MNTESEEMSRLRIVRDGYASEVAKAERDLTRAKTKLESAQTKLKIADEMIASVQTLGGKDTGTVPFVGMGKYSNMAISDAILDVVNTRAGIDGMSVNQIRDVLIADGVQPRKNLLISIHVTADRLERKKLIHIEKTDDGKCICRVPNQEGRQLQAAT